MLGALVASALLLALAVRTRRAFACDEPMSALVLVASGLMVVMCASLLADGRLAAALFMALLTAPLVVVALHLGRNPSLPVRGGVDWERFDAAREAWARERPADHPAP